MAGNFGIVKNTYAAPTTGFEGLTPVMNLWKMTRDLAYYILIIAFIFIGLGIMLRLRIDPRTVMNIQNQIPRVIVCIVMITFSYPFAGLMVDGMWTLTYLGINMVTESSNTVVPDCKTGKNIRELATNAILQTPISFGNQVFMQECDRLVPDIGILDLSGDIANSIAGLQVDLLLSFAGINPETACDGVNGWNALPLVSLIEQAVPGGTDPIKCATTVMWNSVAKVLFSATWFIIIVAAVLFTLFRVWFALLMAFAFFLIYTTTAPIWFVMGLFPKRPLGVEKWIRGMSANILVFPATATMIVVARQFQEQWTHGTKAAEAPGIVQQVHAQPTTAIQYFVPPLVGNPNTDHFGSIIAFAMLLITPTLISLLREKLGATQLKQAAAVGAGIAAGAAIPGMASKKAWSGLTRHNPQTGGAEAPISRMMHTGKKTFINAFTDRGPMQGTAKKALQRMENQERGYGKVTDKDRDRLYPTNAHRNMGQEQRNQNNIPQQGNPGSDAQGNSGKPTTFRERFRAKQQAKHGAPQQQQAQQQGAAAQPGEVRINTLQADRLSVGHIDLPKNKGSMQVPFENNNQQAGEYLHSIMGDRTPHLPDITWQSKAMHELSRTEQDELLQMIRGHLNP